MKILAALFSLFGVMLGLGMSSPTAARADVGGDNGNGGDPYAQEFVNLGYDILRRVGEEPIEEIDVRGLTAAVTRTKVASQASLTLNGVPVGAINYPHPENPRIELSRADWDALRDEPHRRLFLVLHEYLGIMGVDDSSYQVSQLLDRAQVCSRSASAKKAIEDFFRLSCDRIKVGDLARIDALILYVPAGAPLKKDDLRHLVGLKSLNISGGEMLPQGLFVDLGALTEMSLQMVTAELKAGVFAGLTRLQTLSMTGFPDSNNPGATLLRRIEPGAFAGLSSLSTLGFNDNLVEELRPGTFDGLSELRHLEMDGNPIDRVLPGAWRGLDKLQYMRFPQGGNGGALTRALWDGLPSGAQVSLSEYHTRFFHTIEAGALNRVLSRERRANVWIDWTAPTQIDLQAFSMLPSGSWINIDSLNIHMMPPAIAARFEQPSGFGLKAYLSVQGKIRRIHVPSRVRDAIEEYGRFCSGESGSYYLDCEYIR